MRSISDVGGAQQERVFTYYCTKTQFVSLILVKLGPILWRKYFRRRRPADLRVETVS